MSTSHTICSHRSEILLLRYRITISCFGTHGSFVAFPMFALFAFAPVIATAQTPSPIQDGNIRVASFCRNSSSPACRNGA